MRRFVWMASVPVAALALGAAGPLAAAPMAADCHGGVQLGRYMIAFHSGPAEPDEPGMAPMPHRALPRGMGYRHVEVHVMNARTCTPVLRSLPGFAQTPLWLQAQKIMAANALYASLPLVAPFA